MSLKTRCLPLALCLLLAAPAAGCSPELEAGFEDDLSDGYHCGSEWLVAFSSQKTIRAQISLELSDSPGPVMVEASANLADDDSSLQVYVGQCLGTPGCTDVIDQNALACRQSIVHQYEASNGLVEIEPVGEDELIATVSGLVLEGLDGEPDVEVDRWEWPLAGPGER